MEAAGAAVFVLALAEVASHSWLRCRSPVADLLVSAVVLGCTDAEVGSQ